MSILAIAVTIVLAGILLTAAVEKFRDISSIAATVRALGASDRAAPIAAVTLAISEIGLGVAVLFRPDATVTQLGVAALAVTFALAAVRAIRGHEPIRCNCFGAGSGVLGKTQLYALVPWLGSAVFLRLCFAEAPALAASAAWFAATSLILVVFRLVPIRKAWLEARDDRQSAQEMYAWLPSY